MSQLADIMTRWFRWYARLDGANIIGLMTDFIHVIGARPAVLSYVISRERTAHIENKMIHIIVFWNNTTQTAMNY